MRRSLQIAISTSLLAILAAAPAEAQTRKSITSLSANEIASLRRGFAKMIEWNNAPVGSADFRRSLKYWANIHGYIGLPCSPDDGLTLPGMSGLSVQSATTSDEQATWCTCEHGTEQFLTWHRMYVYFFEQVLQSAAGDPSLRLPFWDYETDGHIPEAFRTPTYVDGGGVTLPNPLYVANRQAKLNDGSQALSPAVTSTAGAMTATSYLPFNQAIENTPHGAVHCATGVQSCPSGYMGHVPTAGNDPIFYMHHNNIDRLYECWLQVAPDQRLPPEHLRGQVFTFVDGTGSVVSREVSTMMTTQQLGYSYAPGGGCPATVKPLLAQKLWSDTPLQTFSLAVNVPLAAGETKIPLSISAPQKSMLLNAVGKTGRPVNSAVFVLRGVRFDNPPPVLYQVSVRGPNGDKIPVGVINFFNESAPHPHHAEERVRRFDATTALRQLGGPEGTSLVIEPVTGLTDSTPEAAAKLVDPKANVKVAKAELELR